ncbi:hypothetical protein B0H12DRAFT_300594 [Mycena haematopus]|nr:hypothetical protein B0H12DRAFT_300594 [Mycena haematopus]
MKNREIRSLCKPTLYTHLPESRLGRWGRVTALVLQRSSHCYAVSYVAAPIQLLWNLSPTKPLARPAMMQTIPRPYFVSFECPWLPTKYPYDDHRDGFWDFPERAGWILDGKRQYRTFPNPVAGSLNPILKNLVDKYRCRQKTVHQPLLASRPTDSVRIKVFRSDGGESSLSDEVAFLQSWLFIGVYAQVNAITGVRSDPTSDFATKKHTNGTKKTLSTTVFDVFPHRCPAALNALGEGRTGRWKQLLEVVQHAVTLQTIVSTQKVNRELKPRALTYDECKVLLSIRLLFRAVLLALVLSMSSPFSPDSSSSPPSFRMRPRTSLHLT